MKKSLIILALAIGVTGWSQCQKENPNSSVSATFTGGFAKTMCFEVGLRIKSLQVGAGVGIMVDNTIRNQKDIVYTRNDRALYLNLGYQKDKLYYGARIGNRVITPVTGVVNGIAQFIPTENRILIGGLVGYQLSPRVRFNIGYDTFNETNFGFTFGL